MKIKPGKSSIEKGSLAFQKKKVRRIYFAINMVIAIFLVAIVIIVLSNFIPDPYDGNKKEDSGSSDVSKVVSKGAFRLVYVFGALMLILYFLNKAIKNRT